MRGLLVDANIQGQMENVHRVLEGPDWGEVWRAFGLKLKQFADYGLLPDSPDTEVWRLCQREELILVTANRNRRGEESLEAVIATETTTTSLPVVTIADQEALRVEKAYALRVTIKILEIIMDIDNYRGVGRLYAP